MNKQEDLNDELSRRINADLKEKMEASSKMEDVDFVEDSDYLEMFKKIKV